MQFRDKGRAAIAEAIVRRNGPCAVRDCGTPAQVDVLHRKQRVHFCPDHFNAYGRGELEPIEEEAKQ